MKKQAKTIPFQATAKYYRRTTAKRCQYWDGSTNDKGCAFKRIEDRWVYDRHVSQTRDEGHDVVKIHIVDGRVVEIVCTQGEFKGADMLDGMGEEFAHYYLGIPYAPAPLRPYEVQAQLQVA